MAKKDSNCKACEKNSGSSSQSQIAGFASNNNMTGALTASFGMAVDGGTAGKLGSHFGGKSSGDLMKFIETPGSNKQKRGMTSEQKSKHLINSVGLGNFGLNSTLEKGIIGSVGAARGDSSSFLKGDATGASMIAASALGIDIPNADMLGIGPNDTPMFKLFKLAGFGLKMLCGQLKGKQKGGPGGYTSDTEAALGLILSIGINLDLLARLKSIFDKLMNLKPNFGMFGIQDLNLADGLFNLCDWVENMEYGSDTIDSFRKTFSNMMTNKGLTEAVGKNLISNGTYDTYAANDFGFDQQFKSIAGDIDMLKCDACNFGKTDIQLSQGNETIAQLEFDPRTGLNRDKGYNITPTEELGKTMNTGGSSSGSSVVSSSIGASASIGATSSIGTSAGIQSSISKTGATGPTGSTSISGTSGASINGRGTSDVIEKSASRGYDGFKGSGENKSNNQDVSNLNKSLGGGDTASQNNSQISKIGADSTSSSSQPKSGISYTSNNSSIEFVDDKKTQTTSSNQQSQQTTSTDGIKKEMSVEETKYSQKSISTQVGESNQKSKPTLTQSSENKTGSNKPKSIKEQLGEDSDEDEDEEKRISTSMDETKVKSDSSKIDKSSNKTSSQNEDEMEKEIKQDKTRSHQVRKGEKQTDESDEDKSDPKNAKKKSESNKEQSQQKSGVTYESENKSVVYDTYTDDNGDIKEDKYEKKEGDKNFKKTESKTIQKKPAGGPPADPDADEVKSFHTGETIKREELKGTVLENADMNAVGMLHPNDLKNLKDNEKVQKTLADAEKVYDKTFATEIEKTENLVLSEQSDGIIFGAQLPTLNGNQIVINSERVLISAKTQECGIFSKRKFFVSTDDEITMNAKQRIVLKTDMHTSIESPTIHLGVYTTRNHPSLKGDCTVWWLQDLCDWLSSHTHSDPWVTTGAPTQQGSLAALRARAPTLLSERIFISG